MAQQKHTIDGFVPRRAGSQASSDAERQAASRFNHPQPITTDVPARRTLGASASIDANDLDASLKSLEGLGEEKKGKQRKSGKSKRKRIIKWIAIGFLIVLLGVGGYFVYKALNVGNQIFKGSILDIVQTIPLKEDENGRSNILLFGTSEDDPGHPGAELTDSIMVASVNQKKNEAFIVSIPRDLNVEYGRSCIEGTRGKINGVYQCVKQEDEANEDSAQGALREKVGEVLGLDVQYSVHVNYTALKQMVDAVGGVDVLIESDNPRGIYERYVKLPNGPAHLNGEAALALARARNAEGGYGLPRSNFDREQYQQKILIALRDKAASAGTLANPVAVNGLLEAAGNNIRTNFSSSEIRTLVKLGKDVPSDSIKRLDLNQPENPILQGDGNPVAGDYDYSDLQAFIRAYATGDTFIFEKARLAVLNGSGVSGVAQKEADSLAEKGFNVVTVDVAPEGQYAAIEVYQVGEGMSATKAKLESLFGAKVKTSAPPAIVTEGTNFVIIFGKDRSTNQ